MIAIAFRPVQYAISVVLIDTEAPPVFVTDTNYLSIAIDSSVLSHSASFFNIS